jgi:hypothetical protein
MSDHATLAPSARVRWGNCPGSVREEAQYPEEPSGPAAIDGTHSHTLLEHCLAGEAAPHDFVGKKLSDHEGEFTVDAERAERVSVAIGYIVRRVRELGSEVRVLSEQRVDPHLLTGRTDQSGTVDIRLIAPGFIEIIDYKDGITPVAAEGTLQMLQYAVGSVAELMKQYDLKLIPDCVIRLTIIQPKLRVKGLEPISSWEFSSARLQEEVLKLVQQGAACDDPNAPLVPGDEQCKYCRAKGCSARAQQAMGAVGLLFAPLHPALEGALNSARELNDVARQAAGKNPNEMSNDQIKELLEAAPLIRQMLEAAEVEALRRFEAGQNIEGLKIVRGRGSRAWAFDETEMAEKLKKMGIPKDALWKTSLITPAQAEKVTWTKRDGTQKQLTDRQLATLGKEYVKKSEGKLTVVSASDERPAVTLGAAQMFAPVVEALPSWLS